MVLMKLKSSSLREGILYQQFRGESVTEETEIAFEC
jgi:hypothetical protein